MQFDSPFDEAFEIVLPVGYPEGAVEWPSETYYPEYLRSVEREIAEITGSESVVATQTSYGYGADALAIGAALTGLTAALLSGKRINENLDAWLALGARLRPALLALTRRFASPRISEPAAFAIALAHVAEQEKDLPNVVLLSKATTRVGNASLDEPVYDMFRHHPDRYYVFTIEVGRRSSHVVGIASSGTVLFHHRLDRFYQAFPSTRLSE